jgi:hypothetical protein
VKLSPKSRRTAEAPADPAAEPTAPPTPPRGAPVSAYARILDGQTLWLAVAAAPGSLALREVGSDEIHELSSDLGEDDPAYRSVRADLLGLPGDAEASYDVVLVPPGVRGPRPVWSAPFPRTPVRVPPSRDGRWQFALVRTDEGTLRVRRTPPAPGLEVLDLAVDESGIRVAFTATDAAELRLVEDDTVLATYPVTRAGDHAVAVLTEDRLPEGTGQLARLLAGDTPLRRRANDLGNANHAVLLPVLFGDDPDLARMRLRWSPEGHLVGRIVDRNEGDDG